MAIILAMLSGKGGVGKTCISQNIAHMVAVYGHKKVLAIDCDLSTAGATQFVQLHNKIKISNTYIRFINILSSPSDIKDNLLGKDIFKEPSNSLSVLDSSVLDALQVVRLATTESGGVLDFIPAKFLNPVMDSLTSLTINYEEIQNSMHELVSIWEDLYDLIIFDLGAGYNEGNRLHELVVDLSERVMLVREDDPLSLETTRQMFSSLIRKFSAKQIFHCITKLKQDDLIEYETFKENCLIPLCVCFPNSNILRDLLTTGNYISSSNYKLFIRLWKIIDTILPDLYIDDTYRQSLIREHTVSNADIRYTSLKKEYFQGEIIIHFMALLFNFLISLLYFGAHGLKNIKADVCWLGITILIGLIIHLGVSAYSSKQKREIFKDISRSDIEMFSKVYKRFEKHPDKAKEVEN